VSWKKRLKTTLLSVVTALGLASSSVAGISDDLKSVYDDILANANTPQVVEGQERGYITLGSVYYRAPRATLQPLTITPPRIRVGCSGVDFTAGALSYLNADQLVSWLQSTLQAAPAIAFEIALEKFLPGVKSVLNEVSQLAQTVNQMNLDSCQASRKLVHTILDPVLQEEEKDKQHATNQNVLSGTVGDFFASINEVAKDFSSALNNFFNSSSTSATERKEEIKQDRGDYLYKAFEKKYGTDFDTSNLMARLQFRLLASLIGDAVLSRPGNAGSTLEDSQLYKLDYYKPVIDGVGHLLHVPTTTTEGIYRIVNITDSVGTFKGIDGSTDNLYEVMKGYCQLVVPLDYASFCDNDPGLATIVEANMESIYNKILAHQPLTPQEKAFVAATPLPILKWLNVLSYYPSVAETFIQSSKDWIATFYLEAILGDALKEAIIIPWKRLSEAQKKDLMRFYQVARQRLKTLYEIRKMQGDFMETFNDFANFVNHFERALVTRLAEQQIYTNL